jgi:hypothetical protein
MMCIMYTNYRENDVNYTYAYDIKIFHITRILLHVQWHRRLTILQTNFVAAATVNCTFPSDGIIIIQSYPRRVRACLYILWSLCIMRRIAYSPLICTVNRTAFSSLCQNNRAKCFVSSFGIRG